MLPFGLNQIPYLTLVCRSCFYQAKITGLIFSFTLIHLAAMAGGWKSFQSLRFLLSGKIFITYMSLPGVDEIYFICHFAMDGISAISPFLFCWVPVDGDDLLPEISNKSE